MKLCAALTALLVVTCFPISAQQTGGGLYAQNCATCHDAANPQNRIPGRAALQQMSFDHVLQAITSGSMAEMAKGRSDEERRAIAAFVSGGNSNRWFADGRKPCSERPSGNMKWRPDILICMVRFMSLRPWIVASIHRDARIINPT